MIRPDRMSKITIISHKKRKDEVIEKLYGMNAVHIKDFAPNDDMLEVGTPLENSEETSKALLKIRNTLSKMPANPDRCDLRKIPDIESLMKRCDEISAELEDANRRIKDAEALLKKSARKRRVLSMLETLGISEDSIWNSNHIDFILGKAKSPDIKRLESLNPVMLRTAKHGKSTAIGAFTKKEKTEEFRKALDEYGFDEMKPSAAKEAVPDEKKLRPEIKRAEKTISDISESRGELERWKAILKSESEKAEAPLRFAESKSSVIVQGWVPAKKVREVENSMKKLSPSIFVKSEDIAYKEDAPISFPHKVPVKDFTSLLKMYSLPKYSEFDPTIFMAITFPLFFGFMLGDIGYGILSLGLAFMLRRFGDSVKPFSNIVVLAALSSTAFGFVYGEFFGAEELFGYHLPNLISRAHGINELLTVSVIFGLVHINTGLVLGFLNIKNMHGFKHAFFEKGGWMTVEIAGLLFYLIYTGMMTLPLGMIIPAVIFTAGVAILIKGEGMAGVIELPSLMSHILSYSRLMGVGVASASLAVTINELSGQVFAQGLIFIPFGLIILLIGHAVNFGLGMMECSLHSLRLNWVEFFTKFYSGGGMKYVPFGKKEVV